MSNVGREARRVTQADVARAAGVSQTMVSYVVNGNATISVPEETRQRILNLIDALGYVPNNTARSLRTRKTYTIAGVIPDITNPFYPAFERGVQDVAEAQGYDLIVYNTDGDVEKERKCLESLQQGRVDGVIAVLFHLQFGDLRALLERGVPVVRLEARRRKSGDLPLDNIYVDNTGAARAAVEFLIERGHTRIGMLAGRRGPGEERLIGYRQALEEHHMPIEEDLIVHDEFTEAGGYRAMDALLGLEVRPSAVFAANDMMALGAMVALREARLHIPDDIALIGFDATPYTRVVTPPLTTVTQFPDRLGRCAAQMLFERLQGKTQAGGRCQEMPYELIARGSA